MKIDRQEFLDSLGDTDAVRRMTPEAKADAMETYLQGLLNQPESFPPGTAGRARGRYPTKAEVENQIETRNYRRGLGHNFFNGNQNVRKLPPMPERPTLADFFKLRFLHTGNHVMQSANLAQKNGLADEVVLACLLHDVSQELIRVDHGWWSAELFEPYVPPETTFAIRYHQALRFYPDPAFHYEYPQLYYELFGEDYTPEPYIEAAYQEARKHKWYGHARLVTVNDLYSFQPGVVVRIEQFEDLIGRLFKQPEEGLGYDNSPVAHVWRSVANPDRPL